MAQERELAPGASQGLMERLKGQTVEAIGLLRGLTEEGDAKYTNIIFTIKDGKVVYVKQLDDDYAVSTAINSATGWIDQMYWEE